MKQNQEQQDEIQKENDYLNSLLQFINKSSVIKEELAIVTNRASVLDDLISSYVTDEFEILETLLNPIVRSVAELSDPQSIEKLVKSPPKQPGPPNPPNLPPDNEKDSFKKAHCFKWHDIVLKQLQEIYELKTFLQNYPHLFIQLQIAMSIHFENFWYEKDELEEDFIQGEVLDRLEKNDTLTAVHLHTNLMPRFLMRVYMMLDLTLQHQTALMDKFGVLKELVSSFQDFFHERDPLKGSYRLIKKIEGSRNLFLNEYALHFLHYRQPGYYSTRFSEDFYRQVQNDPNVIRCYRMLQRHFLLLLKPLSNTIHDLLRDDIQQNLSRPLYHGRLATADEMQKKEQREQEQPVSLAPTRALVLPLLDEAELDDNETKSLNTDDLNLGEQKENLSFNIPRTSSSGSLSVTLTTRRDSTVSSQANSSVSFSSDEGESASELDLAASNYDEIKTEETEDLTNTGATQPTHFIHRDMRIENHDNNRERVNTEFVLDQDEDDNLPHELDLNDGIDNEIIIEPAHFEDPSTDDESESKSDDDQEPSEKNYDKQFSKYVPNGKLTPEQQLDLLKNAVALLFVVEPKSSKTDVTSLLNQEYLRMFFKFMLSQELPPNLKRYLENRQEQIFNSLLFSPECIKSSKEWPENLLDGKKNNYLKQSLCSVM